MILLLASLAAPALAAGPPPPPAATAADAAAGVDAYEKVRVALAGDRHVDVPAAAKALAAVSSGGLAAAAEALSAKTDAAGQRAAFGEVTRQLVLAMGPNPAVKLHVFHCPMVTGYGYWVQTKAVFENPYMGKAMLSCGTRASLKDALAAAGG
ncbi:MAG: hypothetical protein ACOZNI_21810 [Myxococcota bacterium]